MKLQECSVDYKTSPNFPSARGWLDNESNSVFGWTVPLTWSKGAPREERGDPPRQWVYSQVEPFTPGSTGGAGAWRKKNPNNSEHKGIWETSSKAQEPKSAMKKTTTLPYYAEQEKSLQGSSPVLQLSGSWVNIRSCLAWTGFPGGSKSFLPFLMCGSGLYEIEILAERNCRDETNT